MGLEDREYLRDEARRYGGGGGFGMRASFSDLWAVRTLLIINVVVFVLQLLTEERQGDWSTGLTAWLSLSAHDLSSFQIWRLVTYGFCHDTGNPMHIVFNMFIFWMFGRMVEGIYGSREFLLFYLGGVIISGLANVAVSLMTSGSTVVVGASGGVYAVVILTTMHFPRMIVYVMFILPMQLWVVAVAYVGLNTLFLIQGGGSVAYAAHLGGAAFGFFYYRHQWRISPLLAWFSSLTSPFAGMKRKYRQRQTRKQLQVFEPNDDELRQQVDDILAKIKEKGEASLTDEERKTLERASRVFRGR